MNKVIDYFNGDSMAADSWQGKYQMKDKNEIPVEATPDDMHIRLAREYGKVESSYKSIEKVNIEKYFTGDTSLSEFGKKLYAKRQLQTEEEIITEIYSYFRNFKQIIPQGSIMSNLGNFYVFGSLSNCFGIAPPLDSYAGILKTDQELIQLMKRRGGVGTTLNNLRPSNALVTNAAKTSSGVTSFAERFSNSTREVAQEGRRGALMLLLSVHHPEIFKFVTMKADRTKVTGANVSVMFTDEFMFAVEAEEDFLCTFPIDTKVDTLLFAELVYNQLYPIENGGYIMKIKAKELFDEFINMTWDNAEPGAAYIDRVMDFSPDGVYEFYAPTVCNPCAEQWFSDDETCRLMAENFFGFVDNPFTPQAEINFERVYEVSYMQQRLGDNLVDLEVMYIDRILEKIESDPEPDEIKAVEFNLWKRIRAKAKDGRRTGGGFTGLGDMLAAINYPYDSDKGIAVVEQVMRTKMQAELDCTIDMAILRGQFLGWDKDLEYEYTQPARGIELHIQAHMIGCNSYYQMILDEFPQQALRMYQYGRRNVSWSTVAPTGTVSLMTQTTSGLEPLFKAYYIRRKKINPNDKTARIDFTDQNGDTWQEYPVLHPKFKEWIKTYLVSNIKFTHGVLEGYTLTRRDVDEQLLEELFSHITKDKIQQLFELSPWYGSEADNISWEKRIEIQSIIQKYTSNAISSTINLPSGVSKETVYGIYMQAWKKGLKGITIYRDGSRTGVLVTDTKLTNCDEFGYTDAIKRPTELEADYSCLVTRGKKYAVIVGKLNGNPYEIFAFEEPLHDGKLQGKIVKRAKGVYSFVSPNYTIENLQLSSEHEDEKLLTRWVSLLLRHGANPKFIAEQVERSEVKITSFAKVVARVLKHYIHNTPTSELCPECHQPTIIYEEGCKKCTNCGNSKC